MGNKQNSGDKKRKPLTDEEKKELSRKYEELKKLIKKQREDTIRKMFLN